jgi:hypothetical protein
MLRYDSDGCPSRNHRHHGDHRHYRYRREEVLIRNDGENAYGDKTRKRGGQETSDKRERYAAEAASESQ